MITLEDYWMGRDKDYSLALSVQTRKNALMTVEVVNQFLQAAELAGITEYYHPRTRSQVSSGWRPPAINSATAGASPTSHHMSGLAVDLYDPAGELDKFAMSNIDLLEDLGLWLEHPSATIGWCHLQLKPPRSGRRVFYP